MSGFNFLGSHRLTRQEYKEAGANRRYGLHTYGVKAGLPVKECVCASNTDTQPLMFAWSSAKLSQLPFVGFNPTGSKEATKVAATWSLTP